ncbi:MAG TPA: type I 3-dehydroquinate dehydratase [Thermoplasmata archaeon]|nr:type I 3-dehydroquinate dehydratase [Thermoplasmata archaeon]
MIVRRTLRIATLPARTAESCREEIALAATHGADWAEVRADRWIVGELGRVKALFPAPLPLLLTVRSRAEGGEGPDDGETRARQLRDLLRLPFAAVDVELQRDLCTVPSLGLPAAGDVQPSLIYSAHLDGEATQQDVSRLLTEPLPLPGTRKIVLPSSVGRAVLEWLPFLESLDGDRPVFHTTGASAPLFRLWAERLGMPFVFASLPATDGRGTVLPGQVELDRLPSASPTERTHPLIALLGAPISQSPSPLLVESLLDSAGLRGTYASLEHEDLRPLAAILAALAARGFVGVNLTRPLKEAGFGLAPRTGPEAAAARCVNLLVFTDHGWRGENTDVRAIRRRWSEVEADLARPRGSVLVLGGGGSARATVAAAVLDGRRVALRARRSNRQELLLRDWPSIGEPAPGDRFEWVVNATTVGRPGSGNWPPEWTEHLAPGTRLLDWVYSPEAGSVESLCAKRGAGYEDGRRLLLYQASETVRELFGKAPGPAAEQEAWRRCFGE